jgi:hypothetical protein
MCRRRFAPKGRREPVPCAGPWAVSSLSGRAQPARLGAARAAVFLFCRLGMAALWPVPRSTASTRFHRLVAAAAVAPFLPLIFGAVWNAARIAE